MKIVMDFNDTEMNSSNRYPLRSFPWDYRIVATTLQSVIFLWGVFGNILLIVVVRRTRALHTPTYCYLVSLAYADLVVLFSAVPEQILSSHLYFRQWALGQVGCSIVVFGNFLGINAGSLSIITFSIERYIAVCHTMLAQKICTTSRAKKISTAVWIFCILYCSPWLGLTITKPYPGHPKLEICDFRLSPQSYVYYFSVDITLFYFLPLIVSVYLYGKIARVLRSRHQLHLREETSRSRSTVTCLVDGGKSAADKVVVRVHSSVKKKKRAEAFGSTKNRRRVSDTGPNSQAIQMLVMVVLFFAISWLPFRGVLIYNTFSAKPWLNRWYMMFAKCAIYINCGINPLLYNAMNRRFRTAFLKALRCESARAPLPREASTPAHASPEPTKGHSEA